ncbi:MAG: hypothetical protein AAFQ79_05140 [Pseudomonadota bacterium]
MLALIVFLLLFLAVIFVLPPSTALFLIDAKTSRVEYMVDSPTASDNGSIAVRGMTVRVGKDFLIEPDIKKGNGNEQASEEDTETQQDSQDDGEKWKVACVTGRIRPHVGTIVIMDIYNGRQRLSLRRDLVRTYSPEPGTTDGNVGLDAGLGTLSGYDGKPQLPGTPETPNPFFVGQAPEQGDPILLSDTTVLTADPECAGDDGTVANRPGFGTDGDAFFINGPGQLGRESSVERPREKSVELPRESSFERPRERESSDGRSRINVTRFPEVFEGEVEILTRSAICRFLASACTTLLRVSSEPMTLRPGAAVTPGLAEPSALIDRSGSNSEDTAATNNSRDAGDEIRTRSPYGSFQGYVTFDQRTLLYHFKASVEAVALFTIVPDAKTDTSPDDRFQVNALERMATEPLILWLFSALLGLVGIIIGLAQIETRRDTDD